MAFWIYKRPGCGQSERKAMPPDLRAIAVAQSRRAFALFPHAKLLVLVRDPIARAFAAWDENRRAERERRSFERAARTLSATTLT